MVARGVGRVGKNTALRTQTLRQAQNFLLPKITTTVNAAAKRPASNRMTIVLEAIQVIVENGGSPKV